MDMEEARRICTPMVRAMVRQQHTTAQQEGWEWTDLSHQGADQVDTGIDLGVLIW